MIAGKTPFNVTLPGYTSLGHTIAPIFSIFFSPLIATLFYFILTFAILSVSLSCSDSSSCGNGTGITLTVFSGLYLVYLLAAFFVHLYSLQLQRVCKGGHPPCPIEALKCPHDNGNCKLVGTQRDGNVLIDLVSPRAAIDTESTRSSGGNPAGASGYFYYTLCGCFPVRSRDDKPTSQNVREYWFSLFSSLIFCKWVFCCRTC